jgi:hypothetical protein
MGLEVSQKASFRSMPNYTQIFEELKLVEPNRKLLECHTRKLEAGINLSMRASKHQALYFLTLTKISVLLCHL